MSVVIKSIQIQYKDEQGEYHGINSVSEKTTADQIAAIEAAGQEVIESLPNVSEYVDDWLDEHPEATTTVQDGSITINKLHDDLAELITRTWVNIGEFDEVGALSSEAQTLSTSISSFDEVDFLVFKKAGDVWRIVCSVRVPTAAFVGGAAYFDGYFSVDRSLYINGVVIYNSDTSIEWTTNTSDSQGEFRYRVYGR